jgi:2,4-diaminopentanoate dehydrogenase
MPDRTYRVIQWATGSIGQIAIRHFAANPAFDLVGAYVTSEAKEGRDAGELANIGPLGVTGTRDVDHVLALDADCVNYAPLYADVDEMGRILRSGKNLVTPVGFIYPAALGPSVTESLDAACRDGKVSMYGSGIHPGFAGDLLPMTFARLCTSIDQVVVQEVADLRNHPSTKMNFEGLGFGRRPEEARADPSPLILTMERIFQESMTLIADGLGVPIERFTTEYDVATAKRPLAVRSGFIAEGCVAGMRFEWRTWSGGRPVIIFRSFWKMDDEVEPDWGYDNAKYTLIIEGEPSLKVNLEPTKPGPGGDIGYWGRVWTAMSAVNAIPAVCDARPGVLTHFDLPLLRPKSLVRAAASSEF